MQGTVGGTHRIEVRPGIVTPGSTDSPLLLHHLGLPDDCSGLRVLDLGARDGFFSFEMERRGAEVLAIDYIPPDLTGFPIAAKILGSQVVFRQQNLYNLTADDLGTFDIVLFLGLLYHLPDPLWALRIVRSLCKTRMYMETIVIDNAMLMPDGTDVPLASIDPRLASLPIMQFFPGAVRDSDPTNWWGPNVRCVEALLAETAFSVERVTLFGDRRVVLACVAVPPSSSTYYLNSSSGAGPL